MKKEIFISIIIWIVFLIGFIVAKITINEFLLCQMTITFIILFVLLYKKFKKNYRSIPEKMVVAKYIKQYQSWDHTNPNEDRSLYVAVYEFELNGKKYTYKTSSILGSTSFPRTLTLYYRKGKRDIHTSTYAKYNDIPTLYRMFFGFLIFPGSALISGIILKLIFNINFFKY